MVNQNKYEVKFNPGFMIKVFNDNYEREYFTCINQLVSILHIDPLTGNLKVCRGRVDFYNVKTVTKVVKAEHNKKYAVNKELVKITIDTSQPSMSDSETIDVSNILEIHPIDWTYPDVEDTEVPFTFEEWYERNNKVNVPSANMEDRLRVSGRDSVH